jgi:hypothetical protein
MTVKCPSCGNAVSDADIDKKTAMAQCAHCGELFDLPRQAGKVLDVTQQAGSAETSVGGEPLVDLPKGIVLSHHLTDLIITHPWYSPIAFFLLFFCCLWDGASLALYYGFGFTTGAPKNLIFFPFVSMGLGALLTYYMLAKFINHTEFTINDQWLKVRHGPLPWFGNRTILAQTIDQLYTVEVLEQTRNGVRITYTIQVILKSGKRRSLVVGLEQSPQARFIEQQIESRLHIKDRPVSGEIPKV